MITAVRCRGLSWGSEVSASGSYQIHRLAGVRRHEAELGIGIRGMEPGWEHWSDDEWTAWYETTPSEPDVMAMAGRWSIDPSAIDDATVTATGIHGLPPIGL
ncbi:hypothetical protein [Micromonospora sp. CP22]|uniref:hypothetical protein n=1 Tax=Micromonospora sp. CP22 TaxID=2580517 RepID=UPI0012BC6CAF|nr:hypothetical protein [Micromonospora sp. CP22]MTK01218.1 hypothetical protein [Micromonospora sp. CP22]